jgi:hypothetical protein
MEDLKAWGLSIGVGSRATRSEPRATVSLEFVAQPAEIPGQDTQIPEIPPEIP